MKLLNGWTIIEGRLVRPNSIMCRDDEPITAKEVKQCLGKIGRASCRERV